LQYVSQGTRFWLSGQETYLRELILNVREIAHLIAMQSDAIQRFAYMEGRAFRHGDIVYVFISGFNRAID
jgi:hypothetical protein